MQVTLVKRTISRFGAEKTALAAALAMAFGISTFTFVDLLSPGSVWVFVVYSAIYLLFIWLGWAYQTPTLVTIAGARAPPHLRGRATGLVAAGTSSGFAICPLIAGPAFESSVLRLTHAYGSTPHTRCYSPIDIPY